MILLMTTVVNTGSISLRRYLLYRLSFNERKRAISVRYKAHAIRLLEQRLQNYTVTKIGILVPIKLSFEPVFVAVLKRGISRL